MEWHIVEESRGSRDFAFGWLEAKRDTAKGFERNIHLPESVSHILYRQYLPENSRVATKDEVRFYIELRY